MVRPEPPLTPPVSRTPALRRRMGMERNGVDVIVIGGGLAGMAAATVAARAGARVEVLEARSAPGGRARTADRDGFLVNEGAHALYRGGEGLAVLRELGVEPDGVAVLVTALHQLGLVQPAARGRWRNSRTARRWLLPRSRRSLHGWVGGFTYDLWDYLAHLEAAIRTGRPAGLHDWSPGDPRWERYMRAMFEASRLAGPAFARAVPARSPERLLDLGGGPGGYSLAMCRRHRRLHATVVDLEGAARAARELLAGEAAADRVSYVVGDLFTTDAGTGYDVAMANNLLHLLPPDRCVEALRRARAALRAGGTMAVLELDPRSQLGALLGLVFYSANGTRTHEGREIAAWLRRAGFEKVRVKRTPLLPGNVVIVGRA